MSKAPKDRAQARGQGKKDAAPEAEAGVDGAEGEAPGQEEAAADDPDRRAASARWWCWAAAGRRPCSCWRQAASRGADKAGKHKKKKKPKKKEGGKKDDKKGASPISEGPDGVVFYTMPDIVANIQTADGRPTFLKLKLDLRAARPDDRRRASSRTRRACNDMFQTFLRELRPEDLAGSQGSYQLRMEIQRRVNLVIAPGQGQRRPDRGDADQLAPRRRRRDLAWPTNPKPDRRPPPTGRGAGEDTAAGPTRRRPPSAS